MKLRELRTAQNKSQQDIANILGITRQAYNNYELGYREPSNEMLLKLADYFDVSLDYLLGRSAVRNQKILNEELSDAEFALYGEAKDLTDEEKQKVLDFIKFTKSQRQ